MDNFEFEKLKKETRDFYKTIVKIYNPAFKAELVFNSNGLNHLCYYNDRSERPILIQKNKFIFFKDAVKILRVATTIQEYRRVACIKGGREKIIEWFSFWAIISFKRKIRIKIIVRRLGGEDGKFHFWSLMPYWNLRHKNRIIASGDMNDE